MLKLFALFFRSYFLLMTIYKAIRNIFRVFREKGKFIPLLFFISCSAVTQKLDVNTVYKKDVKFTVNGRKFKGVGVAPQAGVYEINIDFPQGQIDLLSLVTCHRQVQIENEGTKAYYQYRPTDIEKESACPLEIGVYDKKGRHGWGYILFEKEENLLLGKVLCNGETIMSVGTSICQSQIGTLQRISFPSPVKGIGSDGCEFKQRGNDIEYEVHKDFCYFSFADSEGLMHDHVAFGYETFIVRE